MPNGFSNPIINGAKGEDHGDPFILRYLDRYFLYHTGDTSGRRGISVYESADLVNWERKGFALEPADEGWRWTDLWAPEVAYSDGVFYMYVSATSKREGRERRRYELGESDDFARRNGVATATSPLGPFTWRERPLDPEKWMIDASPFRDTDGKRWMFYNTRDENSRRGEGFNTGIYCQELDDMDTLIGDPIEVALPSERWEGNFDESWYFNEGPFVAKRHGRYYVMFSGGAFVEPNYGVGFTSADVITGPWTKYPKNPFWGSRGKVFGPGHHALILAPDAATFYVVYHGYVPDDTDEQAIHDHSNDAAHLHWNEGRKVLIDRFHWIGDRPCVDGPTTELQPLPPKPVYDPDLSYWRSEVWVNGAYLDVDGHRIELFDRRSYAQLHLTAGPRGCDIHEGGALLASLPADLKPVLQSDGELVVTAVTSYLDDETFHALAPSASVHWEWCRSGWSEINVAVKGKVRVEFGDVDEVFESEAGEYGIAVFHAQRSDEVRITAIDGAATVTDLFLFARDQ